VYQLFLKVLKMDNNNQIAEYSKTEAELSALREVCATTVFDVKTPSGMKQAVSLRAKVRGLRTSVEKLRKETKAPVLALGKLIDSEANRITNALFDLEKPIDGAIKAEESRKAEEKKIEAEREAKVQEWFDSINQIPICYIGVSSLLIKEKIEWLSGNDDLHPDLFKSRLNEAKAAILSIIEKLTVMLHFAEKGENDRAELAEKTKQLDELSVKPDPVHESTVSVDSVTKPAIVSNDDYQDTMFGLSNSQLTFISTIQNSSDVAVRNIRRMAGELLALRTSYEHLLWLTTSRPIETAPRHGKNILLSNGRIWKQGYHHDSDGWIGVDKPTHWQPLPNTPMPQAEESNLKIADDALGM